jgi:hypothetical protein
MRKKRNQATEEQRSDRIENDAQRRSDDAAAKDEDIDAMVERSIKLYGP